jgi:hypothetical protein
MPGRVSCGRRCGERILTGQGRVWTGGSSLVQLRSGRGLGNVRLSCVDVSGGIGALWQRQFKCFKRHIGGQ